MLKNLVILAFLACSGCATIQNHPYATSVAVAFVAGSIAYTAEMNDSEHRRSPPNLSALRICAHGGPFGSISLSCPQ